MYSAGDVSILIAAYCTTEQQVEWAYDSMLSALAQDTAAVIVVDDASTEPLKFPIGVTVISHGVNKGVSASRNAAAAFASTPLLICLDADDTFRDGAITSLLGAFDGTPLYPDLAKFGDENVPHYNLLDFKCDHLRNKVGLAPVNVLHKKEQWEAIGGWREDIDFYEDGEYNCRLMSRYCGKRFPYPLVNYRIHPLQRTQTNKYRVPQQVMKIRAINQETMNMAGSCCGKGKKNLPTALGGKVMTTNPDELPGTQGDRVLALYTGKNKAKHYYRGPVTRYPYKVVAGGYYYVDQVDAKEPTDQVSTSLFVIHRSNEIAAAAVPVERVPKVNVPKEPVAVAESTEPSPVFDISNATWKAIRAMQFEPEQARELHRIEKNGKARKSVLNHLKKFI